MTSKLTITRERLEWLSQISGRADIDEVDGCEIHELARAQLAAMDSEPVVYQSKWVGDGVWRSCSKSRYEKLMNAPAYEVRELYAAPPPLATLDSEPVAWMHNNNDIGIPAITVSPKIGNYWMSEFKDVQPLYRHAQQPVVPDEMSFSTACNFVQINGMAKEDRSTLAMRVWNACRAAMLNGEYK